MIKHLTKHGNSYALVIDRAVMELINIEPETPLNITTDGEALIVAPIRDAKRKKAFEQALAEGNKRYGRMLKKLAE